MIRACRWPRDSRESLLHDQALTRQKEPSMATKALTESNFQEAVKGGIVLVDFWAP